MWAVLFLAVIVQEEVKPTLVVPDGFVAELVLEAPDLLWPSAVHALRDGSLLVAEDPMDMPGPADQPIDRILRLTFNEDGSVATKQVFADGLYAVFGIQQVDDAVLVMNMPHLTKLYDVDDDGISEMREVLIEDLGPPAPGWPDGFNDHIVSGLRLGMDGYLYIAVGDKGIPEATGSDGSTIQVVGGGVVRVRPDGSQLEVVATGLRNVLDVAIDDYGNLFTYDNTDDGLGWWTRLTHVVPGGHYGYPHDYLEHPERHLPSMGDYGGGSPTGGLVLRGHWPRDVKGSLLFCEWGDQTLRRFRLAPDGGTFRIVKMEEFAKAGLVPDFRPTDICESADGRHLYVTDWGHGGWRVPNETGRLWRIREVDRSAQPQPLAPRRLMGLTTDTHLESVNFRERLETQRLLQARQIDGVNSTQFSEMGRRHLLWTWSHVQDRRAVTLAFRGGPADLRRQAARSLGDRHCARREDGWWNPADPPGLRRDLIWALSRSELPDFAIELFMLLRIEEDPWNRHIMRRGLRELDGWVGIAGYVLEHVEIITLEHVLAFRDVYDTFAVDTLGAIVRGSKDEAVRREAGGILGELHRKPPEWDGRWWGTQPARSGPPAHTLDWEGTTIVEGLLGGWLSLGAADFGSRNGPAFEAVRRSGDARLGALIPYSLIGSDDERVEALEVMAAVGADVPDVVEEALRSNAASIREAALGLAIAVGSEGMGEALMSIVLDAEADAMFLTGAIDALGALGRTDPLEFLVPHLQHESPEVRRAAARAFGKLGIEGYEQVLRDATHDPYSGDAAILAFTKHPSMDAVAPYVAGLLSKKPAVRAACRAALIPMREEARHTAEFMVETGLLSSLAVAELQAVYSGLQPIMSWEVLAPFTEGEVPEVQEDPAASYRGSVGPLKWEPRRGEGEHGRVELNAVYAPNDHVSAFARATVRADRARRAEMAVGSDDQITVWVNDELVFHHDSPRGWTPDQDRFDIQLRQGDNAVIVRVDEIGGDWAFSVKVAEEGIGPIFDTEVTLLGEAEYAAFAAENSGGEDHGQMLFFDALGPGCGRCHVVAGQGGSIGPDLSDIAARYSRDDLIVSILNPSARVESHYRGFGFEFDDGTLASGLILREGPEEIVLIDAAGDETSFHPNRVLDRWDTGLSAMPTGLAQGLSLQDFADLVSFLASLR